MKNGREKALVSQGKTTSNVTLKWWIKKKKGLPDNTKATIKLSEIVALTQDEKTHGSCHIEFQTIEAGLCGRSLEEAIRNVNRKHYGINATPDEEALSFDGKSKTDFALDLILKKPDYEIPQYIKNGLVWLNKKQVLVNGR